MDVVIAERLIPENLTSHREEGGSALGYVPQNPSGAFSRSHIRASFRTERRLYDVLTQPHQCTKSPRCSP
jgi:hypothetical protein